MMKEKHYNEPIYSYLTKKLPKRFNASILYHYTSFRTFPVFFGETADLYCTHFAALNDGAEIGHGWQMAIRYLNEHMGWTNEKCNVLWAYYKDGVLKNKVVSPWIMSFSFAEDSLPQWVAYADKKEGGYALGFDRAQLEQMVVSVAFKTMKMRNEYDEKAAPFRMYVLPCLYSNSDKDVIEGLFEFYFNQDADVLDRVKNADKPIPKDMAKIVAKLLLVSSIIKHESFRYEEEVRLIIQPTISTYDECEFLGGKPRWKTNISKYIGAPLCSLLKKILVSPHGDRQVLLTSAQIMKAKHGLLNCEIKESASPYNGR
jgi:hypothetical protein